MPMDGILSSLLVVCGILSVPQVRLCSAAFPE